MEGHTVRETEGESREGSRKDEGRREGGERKGQEKEAKEGREGGSIVRKRYRPVVFKASKLVGTEWHLSVNRKY